MTLPAALILMNEDSAVAGIRRGLQATSCSSVNTFAVFTRYAAAYLHAVARFSVMNI
jgi:hypothetical protein